MSENLTLNEDQAMALLYAATFLSLARSEGVRIEVNKKDGTTEIIDAGFAVGALCAAFEIECGPNRMGFRDGVRAMINERQSHEG